MWESQPIAPTQTRLRRGRARALAEQQGAREITRRVRPRTNPPALSEPTAAPQPIDVLQQVWSQHRDSETGLAPVAPPNQVLAAYQVAGLGNSTIREALQSLHEQGTVRLGPDQAANDITGRLHVQEVAGRDFTQQEQRA
eukprot:2317394-Pyramimonas_sp.AAC.1